MDRARWLADRRAEVEREYTAEGDTYDDGYDPATPIHRDFLARLIASVPPGGSVLDVACGTAPYAGTVLEAGLSYVGTDQSSGMLARARVKWPDARFERVGLQELAFEASFDALMCTDAMEHVPPEDWPMVVSGFRRAVRTAGHVYLTVEQIDRSEIDVAFADAKARGVPTVLGEVVEGDTAGYHFYPDRDRVDGWLTSAGFEIVGSADERLDGYGYHHMLLRAAW